MGPYKLNKNLRNSSHSLHCSQLHGMNRGHNNEQHFKETSVETAMQSIIQKRRIKSSVAQESLGQLERGSPQSHPPTTSGQSEKEEDDNQDSIVVSFEQDFDPHNPKDWPLSRKWTIMSMVGMTGFVVGWASSIDSAVSTSAMMEFGVSDVVESLATGLFLIAFGCGSLVAAPFSETIGRNPVYIISLTLFMIFVMASGLSPNIGAQLAFRFLAGLFACTPLTTFGGSMSDMFEPLDRTYVFPVCACLSFLGPFLAPMVGSFIGQSDAVSWRWTEWTTLILTAIVTISIALFVPETYSPVLLKWKAEALRKSTGDSRYRAPIELRQDSFVRRLLHSAHRPFQMCFQEMMVFLFSLYLTVVYIVLFGFLVGYDFLYGQIYGFSQGHVGLCFIGMNVGFLLALACVPGIYWHYARKVRTAKLQGNKVEPEQRLWYAMLGAPWFPISLFWMGWTAYPQISVWSSLVGSVMFGFSVQGIFISTYQYLIDTYEVYAASSLVSVTLMRYVGAGVMQVVSIPMYKNLGVHWTLTLLGCIAAVMTPVPFVFYVYGSQIRRKYSSMARSD